MNRAKSFKAIVLPLLAGGLLLAAAGQAHATYSFYDLGTAGGPYSMALAINNVGQITGTNSRGTSTRDDGWVFSTWNGTTMSVGDYDSHGMAINSSGQVAGGFAPRSFWIFASTWNGSVRTDLNDLGGRSDPLWSDATGINDLGQVVGISKAPGTTAPTPVLWNNNINPTVLNTLGGQSGRAFGINNSGLAVGDSFTTGDGASHASLWNTNNQNSPSDLGTLGGTDSSALAINAGNQIVGWSSTTDDLAEHAVLWDGDTINDLGTLGGLNSRAQALNVAGAIVGWSELANGSRHASLWNGGGILDLNSLLDPALISAGWVLTDAAGINDHGWIVGTATNSLLGITDGHAFLLSPTAVPVPGAVWLFGSALAGLLSATRRKSAVSA
ncbi:hypothetical protein HC024_04105 [Methylococcaceae bacterium WWC4]|nr:hypothetical protein [Methylococcaceae bacterium WWC4]